MSNIYVRPMGAGKVVVVEYRYDRRKIKKERKVLYKLMKIRIYELEG